MCKKASLSRNGLGTPRAIDMHCTAKSKFYGETCAGGAVAICSVCLQSMAVHQEALACLHARSLIPVFKVMNKGTCLGKAYI